FGRREPAGRLPSRIARFAGTLPRRDAREPEADRALRRVSEPWPPVTTLEGASPYRARFHNGANLFPRRFFFVERQPASRLGENPNAPRVRGRVGPLDRMPWRNVEPPRGAVESKFLRMVVLGESVGPYRLLNTALAVVPAMNEQVFDAIAASNAGYRHLSAWMRDIQDKWNEHCSKRSDGRPRMTLPQQFNHMRKLSAQLHIQGTRVVYTASGTLISAAVLDDPDTVVEHAAYWITTRQVEEARYLSAILNSATVLRRIIPMQPRGWRDPRHFDNLVWELPILEFDAREALHAELAEAAAEAERVAAAVELAEGMHFMRQRRAIRDALAADGIAARIDALVARLLGG
ncbi:MAG TPA: hypothetical protein VJR70_04085, partial [Stellaceae bacterium]|nr:hypothetical protein [Stellaceae bacterium]